jgi:hypothetical protein
MSRVYLYLETCHFIIICFIREDVVLKLCMFKCDVSITFNKWFLYIISLYCHLHCSGVMYSPYNTICSTLNHVADASTPIYIYTYICVCVCVYFNNFILQMNVLTLPLHILRRLTILQPPSRLKPVFKILYNIIL